MQEVVRFLQEHPPWRDLPAESIRRVAQRIEIEFFPRGGRVLSAGDRAPSALILVRSGSVQASFPSPGPGPGVDRFSEGDAVGLDAFVQRRTPDVDFTALEDTLAYLVPRDVLEPVADLPPVRRFLSGSPGERVREALWCAGAADASVSPAVTVGDLLSRPLASCPPGTSIAEAARRMKDEHVGSLVVLGDSPGIVTDRDLRDRVLACGMDPGLPVDPVCSRPLLTLPFESTLPEAFERMVETGVGHLPILRDGALVGIVSDSDLLRRQSRSPLLLRGLLQRIRDAGDAAAWVRQAGDSLQGMIDSGADAPAVGRIAAIASDALLEGFVDQVRSRLGDAPCRWAWLATGSEGRREAAWPPTRAGFVLFEEDAAREGIEWCAALAADVSTRLLESGLRPAGSAPDPSTAEGKGPASRAALSAIASGPPVLLASLLDARQVAGNLAARSFLSSLADTARASRPPDGPVARIFPDPPRAIFRNQVLERDGRLDERLDLDGRCLDLLRSLARRLALRGAIADTATPVRLSRSGELGLLEPAVAADLADAWRYLDGLRLRLSGIRPLPSEGFLDPGRIPSAERRVLRDAFEVIRRGTAAALDAAGRREAAWTT